MTSVHHDKKRKKKKRFLVALVDMLSASLRALLLRATDDANGSIGWLSALCFGGLLLVYVARSRSRRETGGNLFRPKSTLPILGNALDMAVFHGERLHDWLTDQAKLAGGRPMRLTIPGTPPIIVIYDEKSVEDVTKTQFQTFGRGHHLHDVFYDLLGESMVISDGAKWQFLRKTALPLFSMKMMRDHMMPVIQHKLGDLCALLDDKQQIQKQVDLGRAFGRLTYEIFSKVGFGLESNALRLETDDSMIEALDTASECSSWRLFQPTWFWKLLKLLNVGNERRMRESMAVVHQFFFFPEFYI